MMYIRLDVFASLLKVRPEELLHASRTRGTLDGMLLPVRHQVHGAAAMFDQTEANEFAVRWHVRVPVKAPTESTGNLVPLDVFARQAGIPPLEIWLAIGRGKRFRGLLIPAAQKKKGRFFFERESVDNFVAEYCSRHAEE